MRVGPEKRKKRRGGGIIFPLPSSCIRSACKRNLYKKWSKSGGERRVTWHGGGGALLVWLLRWRCCSGGRWRCRGSRTTAPSSGAAVSSGEKRGYCYSPSPLVFHFYFSSFVVKWFPSLYSLLSCLFLSQTLPCFKLVSLSLSPLSAFLFFSSRFLFISSPLLCWRWVVFIGQREWGRPYRRPIVAYGEQGFPALPRRRVRWPVSVASRARLPRFLIMKGRGA